MSHKKHLPVLSDKEMSHKIKSAIELAYSNNEEPRGNMKTCPYCDFVYETQEELYEHLNKTHTRCPCGTVWDNKDAPGNYYYTYCPECYKKEILEEEE